MPTSTITDKDGAIWSLGPAHETLRNGVQVGGGLGTQLVLDVNAGIVFTFGLDHQWYRWVNNTWLQSVAPPTPTPPIVPVPPPPPPVDPRVAVLDAQLAAIKASAKAALDKIATLKTKPAAYIMDALKKAAGQ